MRRVVLDTNILISALLFSGPPHTIVQGILEGQWISATTVALFDELRGVLIAKFQYPHTVADLVVSEWRAANRLVDPMVRLSVIHEDPDDDRVLECAVAAQADCIISGDHHLVSLRQFRNIQILPPRIFLEQSQQESHERRTREHGSSLASGHPATRARSLDKGTEIGII